jgi:hypothetical protein
MNSTGHLIFSYSDLNKEFKLIQTVPFDLVYALDIVDYRMPDLHIYGHD